MLQTATKPINPNELLFQRVPSALTNCIEATHEGLQISLYLTVESGKPNVVMHVTRNTENTSIDYLFNEYLTQENYSLSSVNIKDWDALDSLFGGRYAWQNLIYQIKQRADQIINPTY